MWGAIIGDIAGSIYEFDQFKKVSKLSLDSINFKDGFFSDDTILTIAILEAILDNQNYEYYLKKYALKYQNYLPNFKPYFKTCFSPNFTKWVFSDKQGVSSGNGAMMRISSVGYLFNNEEDIKNNVRLATIFSHNSQEAINCATTIALIIYFARAGFNKEEIINKLNLKFQYQDFSKFNYTCNATIQNTLYALFTSNSYEEAILKVISYGGDTDTNACIVGSMAEALYGLDENLIYQAKAKIPQEFNDILEEGYKKIRKIN